MRARVTVCAGPGAISRMPACPDALSDDFVFDYLRAHMRPGDIVRLGCTCRAMRRVMRSLAGRVYSAFPPRLLGEQGLAGALAYRWGASRGASPGEVDEALAGAARGGHLALALVLLDSRGPGPSHAALCDALLVSCRAGQIELAAAAWPLVASQVCWGCRQGLLLEAIKSTDGVRECAPIVTWAASQLLRGHR